MAISKEREYRNMPMMAARRDAEGAAEESNKYIVEGYATTFDDPYELFWDIGPNGEHIPYYEQIDRHALDGADLSDVIFLYDHAGMVFARGSNGTLTLDVDDKGIFVRADLARTADARNMFENIDSGNIHEMSWCFVVDEDEYNQQSRTWTIKKIGKVFDVSAVSIPANPGTTIAAARKRMIDGAIDQERAERLAESRKLQKIRILKIRAKIAAGK